MPISAFTYDLPRDRIAQRPVYPYDAAKLLVIERGGGAIYEKRFTDLPPLLGTGDLLVFNDTQVLPARLFGVLESGAQVELLLLEERDPGQWICMGRPLKKFSPGSVISCEAACGPAAPPLRAIVEERVGPTQVLVKFDQPGEVLGLGTMPIPPYIRDGRADEQDRQDYQTHFARVPGSIAAPTASLHFTPTLIKALENRGVMLRNLTLHVGPASFLPVTESPPPPERCQIPAGLIGELRERRAQGARIVAVGTTVARALESAASLAASESGSADIFITPGYRFQLVDALITNFHQPGTTHLLMVEALLGREPLAAAYRYALAHEFRFLSYGDGMFIS